MNRVKERVFVWLVIALLFFAFLYAIKSILLPFVVAIILAYFLDPAADKLESWKFSRTSATLLISVLFFSILIIVSLVLIPVFYEQSMAFFRKVPDYVNYIQEVWLPKLTSGLAEIDPAAVEKSKQFLNNATSDMVQFIAGLMNNLWKSGLALVNVASLLFITPIVTIYLLRDWDRLKDKINSLLPRNHAETIREQCVEIDKTLSGYIRGQTNVCLFLGIFYGVGLSVVGLDFGLFIGLATGILSFIPYVGVLFGFVAGITVGIFQFWGDWVSLSLVALVFILGQVIEGNFITPKLVGDKVGLHPLWIIFGMLAGAALFGFVGILLAVPVTSVIGVLVRFAIKQYQKSPLYLGEESS